jgi:hypothetical protein
MDISAHAISLADRPRRAFSGHQGSHAPGRPTLHCRLILSQNRRGKGIDYVIDRLLAWRCSFVRAWRPFLRPDLRVQSAPRAGTVKVGRRACLASRAGVARPRLDGAEKSPNRKKRPQQGFLDPSAASRRQGTTQVPVSGLRPPRPPENGTGNGLVEGRATAVASPS